MPSRKNQNRNQNKKHQKQGNSENKKNRTCKLYRSCEHVPCQSGMAGCRPKYCSRGSSSWASCNMANWKPSETGGVSFEHLRARCKKQYPTKGCTISRKTRISTDQVDALELHRKMPYIWRHLDNKTRRKMVMLARKPVSEIDIKYMRY